MSRTSCRVNSHSVVYLNDKELIAQSRRHILSLSDSNEIRTYYHLVRKRTLNLLDELASWAKWLSVRFQTKWLWARISLLSLKSSLFCQNKEGFVATIKIILIILKVTATGLEPRTT